MIKNNSRRIQEDKQETKMTSHQELLHNKHQKRRRYRIKPYVIDSLKSLHKMSTAQLSLISFLMVVGLARLASAISNQIVLIDTTSQNNATSTANSKHPTLMSSSTTPPQILAHFSTPSQSINITHVTYDPIHDTIYLGATNTIYQLNGSDLSEQFQSSTGPVYDNPSCGITDCNGFEDYMKPTQNVNKILVIDYQHKKLISCGSTKQGACRRYQLNNIAQKEDLISMAVAANDDNSSTYAFIAPARYTYDPSSSTSTIVNSSLQQQQVLYVAATYTKVGQSRDLLVPAIGTRTLDDGPNLLKLYENNFLDSARIDINSHLRDYFLVNYLYGFASSNYIYFVTVQKKATSRDYEELGYHTRIARICITDSSYNSYTEVDLKCIANKKKSTKQHQAFFGSQATNQSPNEYPLLQDAILVDAGSQLLQSLAQNDQSSPTDFFFNNPSSGSSSTDENKVLLAVFSSVKDSTQSSGEHSALCAFSLSQIEDKFNDNIHNCYTGKMQSRNMEYIAGNVQDCPKSGQGGNVVNFCHETLKINGTLPIVSEASIQYFNTTLTAIAATSNINGNSKNIYSDLLANEMSAFNNSSRPVSSIPSSNQVQNQGLHPHTVVFLGTSNGHIKKVLLNNASNGIEFEDVQVDSSTILSDLHLHSSGQQLIVSTPYKVMKVPTQNCGQHSTCRECSQSKNPYCGWCALKRSCTTRNECVPNSAEQASSASSSTQSTGGKPQSPPADLGRQFKWISSDSSNSKCIDLQSIVPDKIPLTQTGKIDLYIDRLPRLPKEQSYMCSFDKREQTVGQQTFFGLSCPLPKVMHRPKIQPGRDHAIVDLAVRSSETNTDFLNGKITFFDCQLHTTCKDCLTTNWGCNWCLSENICLFNTSKCEKGTQVRREGPPPMQLPALAGKQTQLLTGGNTINQVAQCPTFDVGHKQDILIADGSEKELTIKVKNMPQFKGNIKCIVEIENDKLSLKARIEEDRVICENSTYSYAADVGLLKGQLVVIYSDNNIFIDKTNFTLYKCHLLGSYLNRPDCSLCQRIESRFNCAWCGGACHHKRRCQERPDETCPPPRIDYIHPSSGPTLGGTRLTIEGSNLGQSFEEVANRITVGNVPCRPLEEEYHPSNKLTCITGPIVSKYAISSSSKRLTSLEGFDNNQLGDTILADVMVGNKAGYSIGATKFQFKPVSLRDFQPRYGPQSGGTRLTLTGMNLNIGSTLQVFLDELPCLVEANLVTSEQVVCRTSASRHANRAIRQLKLIVDEAQIVRDEEVFYYTQDPVVTKIQPLRSYWSGGRPINVHGSNLTAVQAPRMALLDSSGKILNESACYFQDDTKMQCPSPAINLYELGLAGPSSGTGELLYESAPPAWSSRPPQEEGFYKFRVSFIMDNVWRLRDLQTSYPALNSEITYTSDPKLYPLSSEQYRSVEEVSNPSSLLMAQQSASEVLVSSQYQVDSDIYLLQPGEPMLVLYGEHLRTAVSEFEITVTVGRDLCNLTQLTPNKLTCIMPIDHMASSTDEEGRPTAKGLPLIVVRIGFNLRYELGFVQYHPQLVEQIAAQISRNFNGANKVGQLDTIKAAFRPLIPRGNESIAQKIANYIATLLSSLLYLALGIGFLGLLYASLLLGYNYKKRNYFKHEYRKIQSKIDSLEKSIKGECRLASMALQSDLNELVKHVDLTGIPIMNLRSYITKVFFPGTNNQLLLAKMNNNNPIQLANNDNNGEAEGMGDLRQALAGVNMGSVQHPLKLTNNNHDFPMEQFQRLLLTKPFLVAFINTLEAQASFTVRDRVNVASLLMVVLMQRLDYATDVLKTLLVQLIEQTATAARLDASSSGSILNASHLSKERGPLAMLAGKRQQLNLGKVVGGSASSLMASTTVAAQMLLSRVGNKTSPIQTEANYHQDFFQQHHHHHHHHHHQGNSPSTLSGNCMSTTTFNQRNTLINTVDGSSRLAAHTMQQAGRAHQQQQRLSGSMTTGRDSKSSSSFGAASGGVHLMLRRTDSIVEKMLTNWLALNMYDHLQGELGHSLYMLLEALRGQLDRGPIDSVSGDAYYSLNELKILREPHIRFEPVNLYVIVETNILKPATELEQANLLLDATSVMASFYDENGNGNYATNNTITLTLRVLDCDTISQVKGKILNALYRNSPYSQRLGVNQVELTLKQPSTGTLNPASGQYMTTLLLDEDYTSGTTFNGSRRINTLRHYGINDQAIMMLNRVRSAGRRSLGSDGNQNRSSLTNMLEEHYNNPYTEIQYDQSVANHQTNNQRLPVNQQQQNSWHLVRREQFGEGGFSNGSSPSSNSPSMMLLGTGTEQVNQTTRNQFKQNPSQQQYYHPSSSSTSSTGNVLDTNSTSANSSAMNVGNLLTNRQRNYQQPIYCQIGSATTKSQLGAGGSAYYCQIGQANKQQSDYSFEQRVRASRSLDHEQERQIYLTRMLTSKGTVQAHLDDFFKTILSVKAATSSSFEQNNNHFNTILCANMNENARRATGACPPAVKWLFDLLDETAMENGITDHDVIHSWKSNAFLLRFWTNFIKNPNYILDVEKSETLDASLSVIAQTLIDSCSTEAQQKPIRETSLNKTVFAKDVAKYRGQVKRFYQDIATMKPVMDHEIVNHMASLSIANPDHLIDTNLAVKELSVYCVNYGIELMGTLNNDFNCQQLQLSQQLEQCFRSFSIFEAYR